MEESKICKICNRSFSNGKALGGHLRSHFLKHPLPRNDKQLRAVSSTPPPTRTSFNRNNNNNHQKLRVKTPTPTPTPTTLPSRKRSERRRNSSPLPDISGEEAARFLIHLSRDTWHSRPKEEPESENEQGNSNKNVYDNDNNDNIDKKKKMVLGYDTVDSKKRVYSCKYCRKVFKSGQALGGHKKAHLSTTVPRNVRPGTLFLDLNLPPSLYISPSTCTYNVSA